MVYGKTYDEKIFKMMDKELDEEEDRLQTASLLRPHSTCMPLSDTMKMQWTETTMTTITKMRQES
jgi:hypothetical protein